MRSEGYCGHFVCLFHQYLTCWTSRSESEDIDVHCMCQSRYKIICVVWNALYQDMTTSSCCTAQSAIFSLDDSWAEPGRPARLAAPRLNAIIILYIYAIIYIIYARAHDLWMAMRDAARPRAPACRTRTYHPPETFKFLSPKTCWNNSPT